MRVIVTGSSGLIGSETVEYYCNRGDEVWGIDNNLRQYFFGDGGNTRPVRDFLLAKFPTFKSLDVDIRDQKQIAKIFAEFQPHFIVHAASQPSHDWAAKEPFTDFTVNANGTLNLLEAMRNCCPEAVFAFLSTNKVYGDTPNHLPISELDLRYEYDNELKGKGISETLSVDACLHSLFGASKLSADVLCQEYGKYFGLKIGIFRGGCLTGSRHAGVPLHGFLNYLVHCAIHGKVYNILGYKGKQVRDQIHAHDVVRALDTFRANPRPGEVYNLGGGFSNSASILEIKDRLAKVFGIRLKTTYVDSARKGDHICYYSDLSKFQKHYPDFEIKRSLDDIIEGMLQDQNYYSIEGAA